MQPNPPLDAQLQTLLSQFRQRFNRPATHAVAAPGRVNLIGEHTDYNDGFVLPLAIQRQAVIVAAPRDDGHVHVTSTAEPEPAEFAPVKGLAPGEPAWSNYVKGPIALLAERGLVVPGFDAMLDANVPYGSGLSSSAALEVATATLVESLTGERLDPVDKALLCQQAEHAFPGTPCGIMDMFISAMGQAGHALLIDCRSHETRAVPIDPTKVAVLVTNSSKPHELSGGEYAERRGQCEAAAAELGVPALRDATMPMLDTHADTMDPTTYRRARHVITENDRTTRCADALADDDWPTVGELMFASHDSLRDDFEVSTPELDQLVAIARELHAQGAGVIGARMTGGGFGGCTVTLVHADRAADIADAIAGQYRAATGIDAPVFATTPAEGARVLTV